VAKAAMDTGVARVPLNIDEYRESLQSRLGPAREAMRTIIHNARKEPKSIIYPEGNHPKILQAASEICSEGIARPLLFGNEEEIRASAAQYDVDLKGMQIVDPARFERLGVYANELYALRHRRGITREFARRLVLEPNVFGALMLHMGDADGLVSGVTQHYSETVRPILQIVKTREGVRRAVGVFMLTFRNRSVFIADTTINVEPDAEDLAEIAMLTAEVAARFRFEPRIAMLSFSNFGSVNHRLVKLVQDATRRVRERAPRLVVDGEMQADTAVTPDVANKHFPFSVIKGDANVLVFPDLTSGNIAYKLLHRLGGAEYVGPILAGMRKPAHILHQASEVADVINVTALAVADAQELQRIEAGGASTLDVFSAAPESGRQP
jgi:malate dehydrogenase (oxaloacetate-decarboxylating)(NADP+)